MYCSYPPINCYFRYNARKRKQVVVFSTENQSCIQIHKHAKQSIMLTFSIINAEGSWSRMVHSCIRIQSCHTGLSKGSISRSSSYSTDAFLFNLGRCGLLQLVFPRILKAYMDAKCSINSWKKCLSVFLEIWYRTNQSPMLHPTVMKP